MAQVAQAPVATADEEALRAAVQQYYDAQAQRDVDKTLSFWSTAANPRPGREAFLAVFGEPAEDTFLVEVRRVELNGVDARVRVLASRTRLIMRNGTAFTQRASFLNSQMWRKEPGGWKLLRDGPVADEIADDLIAAAPADRSALVEKNRSDLVQVRLAISQRATMAVTLAKDYVRGRELFELALEVSRAANDRRGEANSLHNLAQAAYFLRDFTTARDDYEKELAIGHDIDDQDVAAAALFGLATLAYSRAEYTSAIGFYREALTVYEKREDGSAIGRTLVSIGNVLYLQGEYDAATASYRRALDLLVAATDFTGATFARNGLGLVWSAQGDLAAALQIYGQVLADARKGVGVDPRNTTAISAPLESIGELYYRLGNVDQARTNFEEARSLSILPDDVGRVSAKLGLSELVAGRYDAALAAYTDSRAKFEKASDAANIPRAWVGIGFSHAAREKWPDAMTAYRTAIRMFDDQKMTEDSARAWLGLSLAQSGTGDFAAALESARTVAVAAAKVGSDDLVWRAAVRAGEALRKLDRLADARAEFDRAIAAIETLAAAAPINGDVRSQLDDSASAWTGLAFIAAAQRDAPAALAAIEARRAHIRRMQLSGFQRDIDRGMTPDEQAEEQGIVRDLVSTRAQIRAEHSAPHPDTARVERLEQQRTTLLGRRSEQQARLYARLPELQQWRGLVAPARDGLLDVVGVIAIIDDARTLIVEYLATDDEFLTVTIARGDEGADLSVTRVPLKRKDFGDQIAHALQPAVLADAREWRTRAAPLAASLLEPIAARLTGRQRVVVVPDDVLWKVPFEALPFGDAILGTHARVTYATSLATLVIQQRIALARPVHDGVAAALFVAPQIPSDVRAQLALAQAGWKEPDAQVSVRIATEAALAYRESPILRSHDEATESAARLALETADIIHVAGPVQVSGVTPLLSVVALAGSGEGTNNDGRWEVREWFRASSHARAMVLSDGSSFGAPGAAAAMDAFAWAAAAAGIPTLVIGRWPSDGFAAEELLGAFHRAAASGRTPADAWATATATIRTKNGNAPSVWTGLRLIGAGR